MTSLTQEADLKGLSIHSLNPLIGCIDDFVSEDILQEIDAAVSDLELRRATVAGLEGAVIDEKRTASMFKIPHETMLPVDLVTEQVANLFRLKKHLCEYPELISYQEGQEFRRHFDAAKSGSMTGRDADQATRSQRIFTAILYLNSDFEGGQTVFPRLDVKLTPKRGTLAFWQNTKPGSAQVHHLSMHEGCPVEAGHKRIISFWFRDRPWFAQGNHSATNV